MYLYLLKCIFGNYVDVSVNPKETYQNHLKFLELNIHHQYKLQYIHNNGYKIDLEIISNVPDYLSTFLKIKYIQKQEYVLNAIRPVVFNFKKYLKHNIYLEKPSSNICVIKRCYDDKITGIEIDEHNLIENGYYKIYEDHIERIE